MRASSIVPIFFLLLFAYSAINAENEITDAYWSENQDLGPGIFSTEGKTLRIGQNLKPKEKPEKQDGMTLPFVNFEPGCMILDSKIQVINGSLFAKNCYFSKVVFLFEIGTLIEAKDSVFVDCHKSKTGGWFNMWSTKWTGENCIFVRDSYRNINSRDHGIRVVDCTFYDVKFPDFIYHKDTSNERQDKWRTISHCRFVNCEIPLGMLIATEGCYFERCSFRDQKTGVEPETKIVVSGQIDDLGSCRLRDTDKISFSWQETSLPADVGSRIPHTYTAGKIELPNFTNLDSSETIAIASVPVPASSSTPGAPEEKPTGMAPGEKTEEDSTFLPDPNAPEISVSQNQSHVKGLLVMPLGNGHYAGQSSQMTLIKLPSTGNEVAPLSFNQPVGSSMSGALEEVCKFIQIQHGGWPRGGKMEISFQEKYSSKDGPSAALACALLLDSAISGYEIYDGLAVTGDLNVDGSVQPIGGVAAKIRGATKEQCDVIVIPEENSVSVRDFAIAGSLEPITGIQIFSVENFSQAKEIARMKESGRLTNAIKLFSEIQEALARYPNAVNATLRHPKVVQRLSEIVDLAPHHLSAKVLLDLATNKLPENMSLAGSLTTIDHRCSDIVNALDMKTEQYSALDNREMSTAIIELRTMRNKLDPRTLPYADAILNFGQSLAELQTSRPNGTALQKLISEIEIAADKASQEYDQLSRDPEVVEELIH